MNTRAQYMDNAKEQFNVTLNCHINNVLLCLYEELNVRHKRTKQQGNVLFIRHLAMKMDTIDGILYMYERYIEDCTIELESILEELETQRDELKLNILPDSENAGCWLLVVIAAPRCVLNIIDSEFQTVKSIGRLLLVFSMQFKILLQCVKEVYFLVYVCVCLFSFFFF